jgi:hypothetical protein
LQKSWAEISAIGYDPPNGIKLVVGKNVVAVSENDVDIDLNNGMIDEIVLLSPDLDDLSLILVVFIVFINLVEIDHFGVLLGVLLVETGWNIPLGRITSGSEPAEWENLAGEWFRVKKV